MMILPCALPVHAEQPQASSGFQMNPLAMVSKATANLGLVQQKTSILIMGVDNAALKGTQKGKNRSDTTILCTIDPATRKVSMVSIPRDSRVPIPGRGYGKVNSAFAYGGPSLAMQTVRSAFNVPVDHYVVVDTSALRKLFEVVGPLEVDVERAMKYTDNSGKLKIDLKPGRQLLTPAQVEQYVRFRHTPEADIGRIARQQKVLKLAFKKICEPGFAVTRMPQLLMTANQVVKTDLPFDAISKLAFFGVGLQDADISMASLPGRPENIRRVSYWIVNKPQAKMLLSKS